MMQIKVGDMIALVDDADYRWLKRFRWKCRSGYAIAGGVSMHRVIMDPPPGLIVDHINGDRLDNRRCNLRLATHAENNRNKRYSTLGQTSSYVGVHRRKERKKRPWRARIRIGNDVPVSLGQFATEVEAALAYDAAARLYHGEFASLNFPDSPARTAQPTT